MSTWVNIPYMEKYQITAVRSFKRAHTLEKWAVAACAWLVAWPLVSLWPDGCVLRSLWSDGCMRKLDRRGHSAPLETAVTAAKLRTVTSLLSRWRIWGWIY